MKVSLLLDTPDGHALIAGTVFDLSVRVTHDDESPASNIPLQWATFRQGPSLDSHAPLTDTDGVASIQVTASPQPHAKPEPIFVQTPDGIAHLIGSVRCRSEQAVIFSAASSAEAASPPRSSIASSEPAVSGGGPYRLTVAYPGPDSVLPADSPQPVYAQLLDNGGLGVAGATIEGGASTRKIDFLQLSGKTDARGWATLWVRGVGLAEKAVDQLTGTVTATCKQYPSSDTKPLNFSTTAGGPGYFWFFIDGPAFEEKTPRLVRARYWHRDGTPGKFLPLQIYAVTSDGQFTDSASTSPRKAFADDFGEALSYVTAAKAGSQVVLCIDAGEGDASYSDPYEIASGSYRDSVSDLGPSEAQPLQTGVPLQLSVAAPGNFSSNQIYWARNPRIAPVELIPLGSLTDGKASARMTGRGSSARYIAYAAGVDVTYYAPQDGLWHTCSAAFSFYNGNVPPLDTLRGTISMSFPDGTDLSMKDWHTVVVQITRHDGSPWPNRVVHWNADIASTTYTDSIFEVPYPGTTDSYGTCSIRIRADIARSLNVDIQATSSNPLTRSTETALGSVTFDNGHHDVNEGMIRIGSSNKPPLKPYVPHPLTARYTRIEGGDPFANKRIVWSAFPPGQFELSPNPSVTDAQGNTSVTLTAVGDDYLNSVTVFARAYNDGTERLDIGSLSSLSFQYGQPATNSAHIALRPVDGDLVSDPFTHLVEATYRLNEGVPLAGQLIHWSVEPANRIALRTNGPTQTDENGVAMNAFICELDNAFAIATVTASATNPNTGQRDISKMLVSIKDGNLVPAESEGYIALVPINVAEDRMGAPNPLRVTYRQSDGLPFRDKDIYWAAYPKERIDFSWPSPTQTDSNGNSVNNITCSIGSDLDAVIVVASSPNYFTGSYDYGQAVMSFDDPKNLPGLQGIVLDKPYARNPPLLATKVDPAKPDQVITGQIVLSGPDHAGRDILISADPVDADTVMFGADNLQLAKQGTKFVAKTNADGVATFKVGAFDLQLLSLQADYGSFSTGKAQLSIALVDDAVATSTLPNIQLKGAFDPMPADTPTFQAFISDGSSFVSGTDLVAVILNDVVVYYGPAGNFFKGVDIAYALLNTKERGPALSNTIFYLRLRGTTTLERKKLIFRASGIAQAGPLAGPLAEARGPRTLQAPGIIGSVPIGPRDIVAGLSVMIPPYRDVTPGDIITAFVYLSGKYSLTARPIDNIATLAYTVAIGDALTEGKPMTLVLPQVYIAGYGAPGELQADYKVTSSLGPRLVQWSRVAGPIALDTTL